MPTEWIHAALGGLLIGLASAMVLLAHGRIAGISGLIRRVVVERGRDQRGWRFAFIVGMLVAGLVSRLVGLEPQLPESSPYLLAVAGLLVGYGTQLGSGCTSGHGVCGMSRGSGRSITSVVVFLGTGALTVFFLRHVF